jgi:hypothetical protein
MKQSDALALNLLLNERNLNARDDVFRVFFEYMRNADADTKDSLLQKVFDIVVCYFKPEKLSVDGLDKEAVRKVVLSLMLAPEDKDEQMEAYLAELTHLDRQVDDTTAKTVIAEKTLDKTDRMHDMITIYDNKRAHTKAKTQKGIEERAKNGEFVRESEILAAQAGINEKDAAPVEKPESVLVDEVKFDFEIKRKENGDGTVDEVMHYTITDGITGTKKCGISTLLKSDSAQVKIGIVQNYLDERKVTIDKRRRECVDNINKYNKTGKDLTMSKDDIRIYKERYELMRNSMNETYSRKQGNKIRELRDALREEYKAQGMGMDEMEMHK